LSEPGTTERVPIRIFVQECALLHSDSSVTPASRIGITIAKSDAPPAVARFSVLAASYLFYITDAASVPQRVGLAYHGAGSSQRKTCTGRCLPATIWTTCLPGKRNEPCRGALTLQ